MTFACFAVLLGAQASCLQTCLRTEWEQARCLRSQEDRKDAKRNIDAQ